jgi:hypothetical protein
MIEPASDLMRNKSQRLIESMQDLVRRHFAEPCASVNTNFLIKDKME